MRIIVTGYIIRRPVGGLAWHYLHYVIGLAQMGHEVYYVEESEDWPSCFNPDNAASRAKEEAGNIRQPFERLSTNPDYGLRFISSIFNRIGLSRHWAYYDAHTNKWHGPTSDRILNIFRNSDILLNISHSVPVRPWLAEIPSRVLVDTDPVFGQIRHIHIPAWLDRALQHNVFATFGENYGNEKCQTPIDGLPWKRTRQPLVISLWPPQKQPNELKFTTVMSWKSYDPAKDRGKVYGLKSDSFSPYIDLPAKTGRRLELALDSSRNLWQMLADRNWDLLNALEVTRDPWSYQQYIQESAAEFSVAKQAYAMTRSGWFSERSAAYLASGRPVLTQETGFSDWLITDEGVIAFNDPEEAASGIEQISKNYKQHSEAARYIAETYFNHELVLSDLLAHARKPVDQSALELSVTGSAALGEFRNALKIIDENLIPGSSFILIDDNQWGVFGTIDGRKCYPLMEKSGLYWGNPANDRAGIEALESLRSRGAQYLVLAKPAYWWRDYYSGLWSHISSKYGCLVSNENLNVVDLRDDRKISISA